MIGLSLEGLLFFFVRHAPQRLVTAVQFVIYVGDILFFICMITAYCFSKIQIGFAFLVPAHLVSPGKRAVKRVCVCVWLNVTEIVNSKYVPHVGYVFVLLL